MPECLDCGVVQPTAEIRRTKRAGVEGAICRDRIACKGRVHRQKAEARAEAITVREVARIVAALGQLDRLRNELRDAWGATSLSRLRAAREELWLWLENHDKEGE